MEINPNNLNGLFTGFQTTFNNVYDAKKLWWPKVATEMPSETTQEVYAWMQEIPGMREWKGARKVNSLAAYNYTLVNRLFELTFAVDRLVIQDDKWKQYGAMIRLIADRAAKWPDYLMAAVMGGAASTLCYDGANFFSASHPINIYDATKLGPNNTTTQSNLFTGYTLTPENLAYVMQQMNTLVDEGGFPLSDGDEKWTLVVPPQLNLTAMNILNATTIAPATVGGNPQVGANDNVLKGACELLMLPELGNVALTGDVNCQKSWYLLNTARPIKPFIWQLREAPKFTPLISPTDPNVFSTHQYLFGEDGRGAAGVSLWWLAAKAVGA